MPVAQTIPPAAFQSENCHQCMRLMPASHADVTRRNATKRPKKTVFAAVALEEAFGRRQRPLRVAPRQLDQRSSSLRPPSRPSQ